MSKKIFNSLLLSIIIVGILLTALHVAYDAYAYRHSSIIHFIANEWW